MDALVIVRMFETAADWFAAILARSKFGMAIAAMISMIATTIRSSIRENPPCSPVNGSELCLGLNIFAAA